MNTKTHANPAVGIVHMLALFAVVGGLLAGVRILFGVPKPLLVVTGIVFTCCAFVFWTMRQRMSGVVFAQMFGLLMAWITVSALLFGTAFWVDRAGWIWFRMTGYNVTLSEDYTTHVDAGVSDFLRRHPMFTLTANGEGALVLRGEHTIDETIVVPRGTHLTIEPGTTLRFDRGCSMISYGTITARGTQEEPIRFTARRPFLKWGVVGLVGERSNGSSIFEHTLFEQGRQARVNGIDFRGCLSIIGGDVTVRNSRFVRLYGKDAVYVRGGDVLIQKNLFQDTFKDGLDLDGGRGWITLNRFVDCGDEGIDLSDNENVVVHDNVFLDARGGRVGADQNLAEIRARNTFGYSNAETSVTNDAGAAH